MKADEEGIKRLKKDKRMMYEKSNNLLRFARWVQQSISWYSVDKAPSFLDKQVVDAHI